MVARRRRASRHAEFSRQTALQHQRVSRAVRRRLAVVVAGVPGGCCGNARSRLQHDGVGAGGQRVDHRDSGGRWGGRSGGNCARPTRVGWALWVIFIVDAGIDAARVGYYAIGRRANGCEPAGQLHASSRVAAITAIRNAGGARLTRNGRLPAAAEAHRHGNLAQGGPRGVVDARVDGGETTGYVLREGLALLIGGIFLVRGIQNGTQAHTTAAAQEEQLQRAAERHQQVRGALGGQQRGEATVVCAPPQC